MLFRSASRVALYTILERGQTSTDSLIKNIHFYFGLTWCSVVVACDENGELAVNLGAVFIGSPKRYKILSLRNSFNSTDLSSLSDASWNIIDANTGKSIDSSAIFPEVTISKSSPPYIDNLMLETAESHAKEGVALAVKRQYPGGISPYMLPGEWSAVADHHKKPD